VLVHATWLALAVLIFSLFIVSIIARITHPTLIPHADRIAYDQLNLPVELNTFYPIILDAITLLLFSATATIIFWQRSDDWMAVLVSVALMAFAAAIVPTLDVLLDSRMTGHPLVVMIHGLGIGTSLLVFYLFPDGKFIPPWTRTISIAWVIWLFAWSFFPKGEATTINPFLQPLIYIFSINEQALLGFYNHLSTYSLILVVLGWFGSGVWSQIHRYRRVATPAQRQQTKWIVFGLTVAFIGFAAYNLPLIIIPAIKEPGLIHLFWVLIGSPIYLVTLLLVPLFFEISILRYRLWDIDFLINRTLVYGAVTGLMGFLYIGGILLIQEIFYVITHGAQPTIAIAATTLVLAGLIMPLRHRAQDWVDRRFYRERVDFRQAFTDFSRRVRTIIDLPELLDFLIERTTELFHIEWGAVFLQQDDGTLLLAEKQNLPPEGDSLPFTSSLPTGLRAGISLSRPTDPVYPLLVPLMAPQRIEQDQANPPLLGLLALGPRRSGLGYYRQDLALLTGLADQAGTAIYVARLIQEKQAEASLREEAEHRLEEHRHSPIGQAETLAHSLITQPETALVEIHQLTQTASKDPNAAAMLSYLPSALGSLNAGPLPSLAEGFDYLFTSQFTPELTAAGLRTIILQLVQPEAANWHWAAEALEIYRRCQARIEVGSIAQITGTKGIGDDEASLRMDIGDTSTPASSTPYPFVDLERALAEIKPVSEALRAYERVDTAQDKLAYLASAVERLRHVERFARTELGSADRAIIQRIAESWLAIVTGVIGDLQARAQIVCQLITRHTWQDDIISLALSLHNEGRGSAMKVHVTLAPDPAYTLIDESATIERLAPNEEVQVHLRVRPRLEKGVDHFRARFVILYTDPRGSDQVENFADEIQLLAVEGAFQFIPNPYVVGTPLQTGSPLFFGREDVIAFVQENLAALHRNNLVLIGQRRTGKTSLLKQLPARLGDNYLAVYLDGQSLGLDPGLPNFFLALATEITFALEDRGFIITPPELSSFADSPAAVFEHNFLEQVREVIGERHLLLMLDEFEELETAVQRGDLESSIFGFLRHLIQHSTDLSVIFCGTHRLEELAADYWNVLFNISLYRHIAFLDKAEALRLIQEPVAHYGMRYDDLALDKIWRVTAGHPYFLQLLCHSQVNRHNRVQRSYVTVADVNAALDEILASGEAHFVYLWTESTSTERLVLTVLSRMIPLSGHATPVQIADYLTERGVSLERQAIGDALHHLALRDVISLNETGDASLSEEYAWRLGLLGMWVEKYKSMSRVVDEARKT
jgi:hypothetical protein